MRVLLMFQGIKEHSSPISLDSKVNIDLVIVGSVAVSKKGKEDCFVLCFLRVLFKTSNQGHP